MYFDRLTPSPESRFIKFGQVGNLGILALDRPDVINSLNSEMCVALLAQLDLWSHDDSITSIAIYGTGERGFCAGGDVVNVRERMQAGKTADRFFRLEYELDRRIATFEKPWLSFMSGTLLGGGLGLSVLGSHRIVCETTKMGMPETKIGFFPDVGMRWYLAEAPGEIGVFLALTGRTIGPADAIAIGWADAYMPSDQFNTAIRELAAGKTPRELVEDWHQPEALAALPSTVAELRDWVDEAFEGDDLNVIMQRLASSSHPEAQRAAREIRVRSPLSCHVALRGIREAESMRDISKVIDQDLRIVQHFTYKQSDFSEGVRAQLVDKDRQPNWWHQRIEDVPADLVQSFFTTATW